MYAVRVTDSAVCIISSIMRLVPAGTVRGAEPALAALGLLLI